MSYVNYHPVFLALAGKPVLIVGGGKVAMEKLESLLPTGAHITIVSPTASTEIQDWDREGVLQWQRREFRDEDVEPHFMIVAATDNPEVNAQVFRKGEELRRLSNSVDDPINCNFIMAAIARKGPMQVAVSSAGCSPALAQRIRRRIADDLITDEVGELADFLGSWRARVKDRLEGYKLKQAFWESVIDSHIPSILERGGWGAADEAMANFLDHFASNEATHLGKVSLVGAGPGDPELMTLKAIRLLASADVVLYDRLANPQLLKRAKASALLVDVGKAPGECGRPRQETIHALMIEHALRGRHVVRLKGGDPFVFGRGGEEVLALREDGIEYEVVPGVSSCIAAAEAAEIPVTHRGLATGFAVFTAQGAAQDLETVPWEAVANLPTLVLLMGVDQLPKIVENLRRTRMPGCTPIAVISHACLPTERIAVGDLDTIERKAIGLPSPATIVVGEVVRLAKSFLPAVPEAGGSNLFAAWEPDARAGTTLASPDR